MLKNPSMETASARKTTATKALNHGLDCIEPKARSPTDASAPRTPYATAMPSPYAAPRIGDLPMMMRLTGIIGSTHGVRLRASPPRIARRSVTHVKDSKAPPPFSSSAGASSAAPRNARNSSTLREPRIMRDGFSGTFAAGAASADFSAPSSTMRHTPSSQTHLTPFASTVTSE